MRSLLCLAALVALPAFATGETIVLTGAATQLRETLCFSMTCVESGPRDFVVTGRTNKGSVELTVTSRSGQPRLTHSAPLNAQNKLSSTDLVTATALVQRSIEVGPVNPSLGSLRLGEPSAVARGLARAGPKAAGTGSAPAKPVAKKKVTPKRLFARR